MKARTHETRWRTGCLLASVLTSLLVIPAWGRGQVYWFESYQRAVELIRAERIDEASFLLDEVIRTHPAPVAQLRVPGNRIIQYVPYYHRARVQLARGDACGAAHSLEISEAFGAVSARRKTLTELRRLRRTTRCPAVADASSLRPADRP